MTLKENIKPVRLAETGRHLFDAPYCYTHSIDLGGVIMKMGNGFWTAPRELTDAEHSRFLAAIEAFNLAQEIAWDVNQPIDAPWRRR